MALQLPVPRPTGLPAEALELFDYLEQTGTGRNKLLLFSHPDAKSGDGLMKLMKLHGFHGTVQKINDWFASRQVSAIPPKPVEVPKSQDDAPPETKGNPPPGPVSESKPEASKTSGKGK